MSSIAFPEYRTKGHSDPAMSLRRLWRSVWPLFSLHGTSKMLYVRIAVDQAPNPYRPSIA